MRFNRNRSLLTTIIAMLTALAFTFATPGVDQSVYAHPAKASRNLPMRFGNARAAGASVESSMQMPLVAPLFIQDRDFTSTLVMVNGLNQSTYADVTLDGPDGTQIAHKRVGFPPRSQQRVEVYELLQSAVSPVTTGRLTVAQNPDLRVPVIFAQLSITYAGASDPNFIDEELAMPSPSDSQVLRGVADEAESSPFLALTSLSESVQHVLIECLGRGEHPKVSKSVELRPAETLMMEACTSRTIQGGDLEALSRQVSEAPHGAVAIALSSDGSPGSFAAFGLAPHKHKKNHFFSAITFTDPKQILSTNTVFAGVPVGTSPLLPEGTYVPHLALANFSANDRHVQVKFARTVGSAPMLEEVADMVVPAMSSKQLTLENLTGDPNLRNSFSITSDGSPGDLIAKLTSASESELREVELQGKDASDYHNGGNHPWSLERGNESTLLLFNHSTAPQHFNVHIGSGALLWDKSYVLQPMETMNLNLRELIQDQVKDNKGRALPKDVQSGQINWFTPNRDVGHGRLMQSNRETAMARSFSCADCSLLCRGDISIISTSIGFADTQTYGDLTVYVCLSQCSPPSCKDGYEIGTGSGDYSWTSSQPAVAPISGSSSSESVNLYGAGLGTTDMVGSATDGYGCEVIVYGGPEPVTITVTIGATANPAPPAGIARSGGTATITPCATVGPAPSSYSPQTFTITTSAPQNPNNISLTQGATSKDWTTGAIAAGNSECASGAGIYNIETTTGNTNSGTLTYQVFGQPATNVTFKNTSATVKVN